MDIIMGVLATLAAGWLWADALQHLDHKYPPKVRGIGGVFVTVLAVGIIVAVWL